MHADITAYISSFYLAVHGVAGGGGVVLLLSWFLSALLTLQPPICDVVVVHGSLVAGDDGVVLSTLHGDLACYVPLDVIVPPLFLW